MNIKKLWIKLTALILIVNLVFIGPAGIVVAQEATAENSTTGSSSDNTATTDTATTDTATNNNDATVSNTTTGDIGSGSNTTSDNTGDATIDTSDSSATIDSSTTVNTNTTTASPTPKPSYAPMSWTTWTGQGDWTNNYSTNTQTGSNSTNTATATTSQTDNLINNNEATINNNSDIGSTTGSNTASDNTGDATINTGNANLTSSTQNVANLNFWTGSGDWTNLWNGEALNYLTGSGSDNEAAASVTQLLTVLNENGIDISNILAAHAASGANIASDNTGNATIVTGDASLLSTLFNLANTNIFGTEAVDILYQDIYGNYSGNIDLSSATPYSLLNLVQNPLTLNSSNNKTGSNSDNLANVSGSLTFDILSNNDGNLVNNWDLAAITGSNTTSDNTGDATINTGNADIIGNLINMLNTNIFTNNFYFGVVNVYGNWLGNLILPEYPVANSYAGNTTASSGNSMTGFNSENTATTTQSQDLSQTNDNDGTVANNINLNTESGGNSASDNTLNGAVSSGNTYAEANLANWVNTNIVSDSPWWLVMVNNLGTWIPILQNPANGTQIILDLDALGLNSQSSGTVATSSNNQMTGSGSDNTATTDLNLDGTITNNNTGTITNNIDTLASTGGNSADRNTGFGSVTTGDASIWLNVLNFLNTNISAPSVMLTIVNVFGSWTGDILNFGTQNQVATNNPPQNTNSGNSGGGSLSSSSSSSSSSTSSTQASNTGGGSTSTGGSIVTQYSYSGGNNANGQVLSFSEDKSDSGDTQGISGSQSQFNSWILFLAVGLLLTSLMGISVWQRRRVVRFLRTTRISLF